MYGVSDHACCMLALPSCCDFPAQQLDLGQSPPQLRAIGSKPCTALALGTPSGLIVCIPVLLSFFLGLIRRVQWPAGDLPALIPNQPIDRSELTQGGAIHSYQALHLSTFRPVLNCPSRLRQLCLVHHITSAFFLYFSCLMGNVAINQRMCLV